MTSKETTLSVLTGILVIGAMATAALNGSLDSPPSKALPTKLIVPAVVMAAPIVAAIETPAPEQCTEPSNPFEEGSGHYAGFEYAATHGEECTASSVSFQEGCDESDAQEDEYDACVIRVTKVNN